MCKSLRIAQQPELAAEAEGIDLSKWIRRLVSDALIGREQPGE